MKLIADSGSTKTNWCLVKDTGDHVFVKTPGLNPFFRSTTEIADILGQMVIPAIDGQPDEVFFYGAGVTNEEKAEVVKAALRIYFPHSLLEAESDLLAAARATCFREAGIACILGTGSNSCYYDGVKIADQISPLGFILGDEGSGAVMGKKLVGDYLKRIMPSDLREEFNRKFPMTMAEIMEKVYRQPRPNKFLAGFTHFLSDHIKNPWCHEFVKQNLKEFITRNVMGYDQAQESAIHFTGSLAYHFRDILFNVLEEAGLRPGHVLKDPMPGLISFHF